MNWYSSMYKILEKTERRLGERLHLKGERCLGPKCALVRRSSPPGAHGKKRGRGRRNTSEFLTLMREKQKVRFLYGLDDREIERYSSNAAQRAGVYAANFLRMLETRLDNAVFRLGLADSRRIARQIVGHGHITVNGRRVTIPSYAVKPGDIISLQERSLVLPLFTPLAEKLKKFEAPKWLLLDPNKKSGTVKQWPDEDDARVVVDVTKIKEFYSR